MAQPGEWQKSLRRGDLTRLGEMRNGSIMPGQPWTHWCQGRGVCCENSEATIEEACLVCVNVLYGGREVLPAESTWTHVTWQFKRTIMRRVVFGVGVWPCGLQSSDNVEAPAIDVDGAAAEDHFAHVRQSRLKKTASYLVEEKLHELAVYTILLDFVDKFLLYPLLGDNNGRDDTRAGRVQKNKFEELLRPNTSTIGKF